MAILLSDKKKYSFDHSLRLSLVHYEKKFNITGFEKTWVIAKNLGQLSALTQIIHARFVFQVSRFRGYLN